MKLYDILPRGAPITDRLEAHSIPEPNSGCWLWMAACGSNGYPVIKISKKSHYAHRVSYEEFVAPIPGGLCVLHRCDTPICINPAHLFLGTNQDNIDDMVAKGRQTHGAKNPRVKLTEAQVLAIFSDPQLRALTPSEVGKMYGVTRTAIHNIWFGKRWSILTGAQRTQQRK